MYKKKLKSVFSELLPTEERKAAWQTFMEQTKHLLEDPYGSRIWGTYKSLTESREFLDLVIKAAQLELTLTQLHQMNDPELTIGSIKQSRGSEIVEYVIVRSPFIEPGKKRKEVRVYLGRLDEMKKSLAQLRKDPKFHEMAKQKVLDEMTKVFKETQKNTKRCL
jgi:hypothetical protein